MIVSLPYAFLTGAPGAGEWVLLFLAILLLFGPRRLPEIARTIGRVLEELRRASTEFRDQVMQIDDSSPRDVSADVSEVAATEEKPKATATVIRRRSQIANSFHR